MWSCSVEENLAPKDLEDGPDATVLNLFRRTLWEELGLDKNAYDDDTLRLLSVFLESELLNPALCGYAKLNLDSTTLDRILKGPATDIEFVEWDFLDWSRERLLGELRSPKYLYHPTTGYRLLCMLLHQIGYVPKQSERFFF